MGLKLALSPSSSRRIFCDAQACWLDECIALALLWCDLTVFLSGSVQQAEAPHFAVPTVLEGTPPHIVRGALMGTLMIRRT